MGNRNVKIRAEAIRKLKWETSISTSYRMVLQEILEYDFGAKGVCKPFQKTIASDLGTSVSTVQRAVRWGKDLGFLKTTRDGVGRSSYIIDYKVLHGLNKAWKECAQSRRDSFENVQSTPGFTT